MVTVTNTLTFYKALAITTVKSFIVVFVQASEIVQANVFVTDNWKATSLLANL